MRSTVCINLTLFRVFSFSILTVFLFGPSIDGEVLHHEEPPSKESSLLKGLFSGEHMEWGGHLKNRMGISWPMSESIYAESSTGALWDSQSELRLNFRYAFENVAEIEIHNESFILVSDTLKTLSKLQTTGDELPFGVGDVEQTLEDRYQLMDLTWVLNHNDRTFLINRFDRLSLALFPSWGVFKIGRQAITWGNGMLFNPFDIFTPFAPTTIDRDYKQGEDAVSLQININDHYGDLQLLYVPRREPDNRDLRWEESSLAGKYHLFIPSTDSELTLIGGKHFQDTVLGVGVIGYLGGAAWRFNTTWTYLDEEKSDFFSLVANMDYAWVWWGKNFYGWVEYYFNGLGEGRKEYAEAFEAEALRDRLQRGELFVRGRHYVDTQVRVELHPLVNFSLVTINNVVDPSGIVQPYLVWDVRDNLQFYLAVTMYWGSRNSEFGGVEIDKGTDLTDRNCNSLFTWLTFYF